MRQVYFEGTDGWKEGGNTWSATRECPAAVLAVMGLDRDCMRCPGASMQSALKAS